LSEVEGHDQDPAPRDVVLQAAGAALPPAKAELTSWIEKLLRETAPDATSLVVRLVGGEEMRRLNQRYRSIDRATDVLSFPADATPEERHLGDIVVCVPLAERQAIEFGHSLMTELKVLVLHGMLHCLGLDHETDQGEMEALEADLRRRWVPESARRG
jgi:probable rRNA maturation factor